MAAQALEPTLMLQSQVVRQGPAELESSCSGGYTGAAEPSAYLTEAREEMASALGSAAQPAPDAGQDSSRPFPPPPRGLPGSCCGSPECIVRQTRDMRERYCCWRLNTLYCPHCGHWLPQHVEGGIRHWTKGQWEDLSPKARDGITIGCKACVAANEQEEAAIMKQSLEAREQLRQQPRGGEACARMDHD